MQSIISNPTWIAIIILAIISIALLIITIMMYFRLKKFLVGVDSKHISDSLSFVSTNLDDLQAFKKDLELYLTTVEKRLKKNTLQAGLRRPNEVRDTLPVARETLELRQRTPPQSRGRGWAAPQAHHARRGRPTWSPAPRPIA